MARRRQLGNPISLFSFQDIVTAVTGILILLALTLAISVITQGTAPAGNLESVDAQELVTTKARLKEELASLQARMNSNQTAVSTWLASTREELEQQLASYQEAVRLARLKIPELEAEVSQSEQRLRMMVDNPEVVTTNAKLADLESRLAEARRELDSLRAGTRVFYNFRAGNRAAWLVQISGHEILVCRANTQAKPEVFSRPAELMKFVSVLPENEQYLVLVVKPSGLAAFEIIRELCAKKNVEVGVELIGEEQVVVDPETGASEK